MSVTVLPLCIPHILIIIYQALRRMDFVIHNPNITLELALHSDKYQRHGEVLHY
jgi:hypothetical protein